MGYRGLIVQKESIGLPHHINAKNYLRFNYRHGLACGRVDLSDGRSCEPYEPNNLSNARLYSAQVLELSFFGKSSFE